MAHLEAAEGFAIWEAIPGEMGVQVKGASRADEKWFIHISEVQ